MSAPGPISSVAVIHQFGSDRRDSGHRADIVDRSKMTQIQLGVSYFEQPGSQGQMLQHAVSATVSLLRISAVSRPRGLVDTRQCLSAHLPVASERSAGIENS